MTADSRTGPPAGQDWNPERYARNARFVAEMGAPVLDLLAPRRGERILDLGCGDGALTKHLVAAGASVLGVDASPEQVAAARARGLDARVADGEALAFEAEFDAVFSNAALHWMRRPAAVVAGVRRALRPGGRFVGEFGGDGNVDAIRRTLIAALDRRGLDGRAADPWYFPTAEAYRALLEAEGFRVDRAELIDRPVVLPTSLAGWLDTFAGPFYAALEAARGPGARGEVRDEVVAALRESHTDADGRWIAPYRRLRFAAGKPATD